MNKLGAVLGSMLFISLAGNLFMGGLMLGDRASTEAARSDAGNERRAEWRKRDEMLRQKLSEADRVILEEVKRKYESEMEGRRKELEAAREKLEAAHAADPVDTLAIERAGREEAIKKAELLKTVRAARKEISGRLSPEGRLEMEKIRPPKGKRGDRRPREAGEKWRHGGDHRPEGRKGASPEPVQPIEMPGSARPDYDQPTEGAPQSEDCGGCEVPGAEPPQP